MAQNHEPLQMRVGEAKQRDIGKKRARMGPDAMDFLGLAPGDIVEISGKRQSCATAWPADEGERAPGLIRIDGQTRKSMGVSLNDIIRVKKTAAKEARAVTLIPADGTKADTELTDFVKKQITDRPCPLVRGDEIAVAIMGNSMVFQVGKTAPGGIVWIDQSTSLSISANAAADTKDSLQADEEDGGLVEEIADSRAMITYEDIGGLSQELKAMREIVELPLRYPELFTRLGVEAHSGVLLYGPPGCGKTLIAKALASESDASMYSISGPEIVNKYYGETEARLRDIFKEAKDNAPSIIFIDEIDAIAPKREEAYGDVEKRMVAQLLALMDGLDERGNVIVLGATNRPNSVEPALRRPGRFDREFEISVPNTDGRRDILHIHTRGMPLAKDIKIRELASELHGYTGADIKSLCREAATRAIRRYLPQMDLESEQIPSDVLRSMEIRLEDFHMGMHEVVPTAMREFYVERPKVHWADVGGLDDIKEALKDNLIVSMRDPSKFTKMGIRPPKGALLYGPPGCGKTLVARALATESGANMILVRGPEILSKWLGESEKAVREIFRKAKASSPCVVIFDELDSLARQRGGDGSANEAVLSQLLTEMEEGTTPGVAVIGITNRPDVLDVSLMRTGRLDLSLYVGPPEEADRLEIIRILTKEMPLDDDLRRKIDEVLQGGADAGREPTTGAAEVDGPEATARKAEAETIQGRGNGSLPTLAATQNYSGADLATLCREAAVQAMRRGSGEIDGADFDRALRRTNPSITPEMRQWYKGIADSISSVMPKKGEGGPYG